MKKNLNKRMLAVQIYGQKQIYNEYAITKSCQASGNEGEIDYLLLSEIFEIRHTKSKCRLDKNKKVNVLTVWSCLSNFQMPPLSYKLTNYQFQFSCHYHFIQTWKVILAATSE